MAYVNQEDKKVVASKINPILKKYGLKGTLSIKNNMKLVLTISSGPIDFIKNHNDHVDFIKNNYHQNGYKVSDCIQVNQYWYKEHFTGVALEALNEIIPAMYTDDWFDDSDASVDYFNTAYYIAVHIGNWDKPYKVI